MASTSNKLLLKNGTVLSFDEDTRSIKVLHNAAILIGDGTIDAIFNEDDSSPPTLPKDCQVFDVSGKIVSPGFVNTHLHAWMTAYRSMSPDITLTHYLDWLAPYGENTRQAFPNPEDTYWSALEGFLEGLNGGVTTVLDHDHACWSAEVLEKGYDAAVDSGARVWWCCEPQKKFEDFGIEGQWETLGLLTLQSKKSGLVSLGISYQGLAGAKGDEFETVKNMVNDLESKAITIHHVGGPWPSMHSSPTSLVEQNLPTLGVPIILSHAGYLTDEEQQILQDQNFHISITPESEDHYGHGQTTGHLTSDQASLGVDTAFTFSGDILTQARLWLQKARDYSFQEHLRTTGLLPRNTPLNSRARLPACDPTRRTSSLAR